ncbi:MAG: tRNA (adenosine(37)-N6)-dimethylallyltransferase MiaA [Candidatus Saganbacteria bacterium]|nr:tRNA (adenosine(37)-N6)-dimethylallyltransferase MiaA [Candidatus Saganbacteria bacterium]
MTKTLILFGPTASGKTDLSIELARHLDGEIISADSMQVYRYMDIGTAKASKEQRGLIPHHLIDIVDPDEEWTVSSFIDSAKQSIGEIVKRKKQPVMVGGTGLYLNAFINGYSFPIAAKDDGIRKKLSSCDTAVLYERLKTIDPRSAEKINANDKKRIIRALEVYEQTGRPISELQKKDRDKDLKLFCLDADREVLYMRIGNRVDDMIKKGLEDEVYRLLKKGYSKDLVSMQALGYKEMADHIEGKRDLADTVSLIKQRTRNFARRQLTWFRRFEDVIRINISSKKQALEILSLI